MLQVLEIKPNTAARAVSIVEADVNVDFAPPPGYKEQVKAPPKKEEKIEKIVKKEDLDPSQQIEDSEESEEEKEPPRFQAFSGAGIRISGKDPSIVSAINRTNTPPKEEAVPIVAGGAVVYKPISEIDALRKRRQEEYEKAKQAKIEAEKKAEEEAEKKKQSGFIPFSGQGYRMK